MDAEPTVFVIDDDDNQRQMLRWLFESVQLKVRDFSSARAYLEELDIKVPGCAILDLRMPEMDGLELLHALRAHRSAMPVIMLSAYGEIPTAVKSMQLGAVDFLEKPVNHQYLLERVRKALAVDQRYREEYGDLEEMTTRLETLTPREREVLQHIVQGKANKAIAWELGNSVRTIETHRANLMNKLQIKSVAELVRLTTLPR